MSAAMISLAVLLLTFGNAMAAEFSWPGRYQAAVSLTYDDALDSQLANALPALNKAGLKGTFYIIGQAFQDPAKLKRWQQAPLKGHELGNHTLRHPCGESIHLADILEYYNLETIAKELDDTTELLKPWHASGPWTFAYPCGQTWVGADHTSYIPEVAKRFIAARGVMEGLADPTHVNMMEIPCVNGGQKPGVLCSWVDQAMAQGKWLVFMFHGVGGDYLSATAADHQVLVDYLAKNKKKVWVAPFNDVASWIKAGRSGL